MFESRKTASNEEMSDVSLTKSGELQQKGMKAETLGEAKACELGFSDVRVPCVTIGSKETASKQKMSDVSFTMSAEHERKTLKVESSSKAREGTLEFSDHRVPCITVGSTEIASKEEMSIVLLSKAGELQQKSKED